MAVVSVAMISTSGCWDLAARRELKAGQFIKVGDTRGKPFEIESRLPADWGKVRIVQSKGRAGPQTTVEVPPGHDVRILLVPATSTANILPEPPEMERRDIMGPPRDVPFVMPNLPPVDPGLPEDFIERKGK